MKASTTKNKKTAAKQSKEGTWFLTLYKTREDVLFNRNGKPSIKENFRSKKEAMKEVDELLKKYEVITLAHYGKKISGNQYTVHGDGDWTFYSPKSYTAKSKEFSKLGHYLKVSQKLKLVNAQMEKLKKSIEKDTDVLNEFVHNLTFYGRFTNVSIDAYIYRTLNKISNNIPDDNRLKEFISDFA